MSGKSEKKKYSSVMEKIIKNAVSETSKVLENIVEELKAEVLRVKGENENLRIRCSQFEDVIKKRSIYRETGTSPEPYIIEKCDKAVQCDLFSCQASNVIQDQAIFSLPTKEVQTDDEEQNLSLDENETQDSDSLEIPFGPIYEKDCSNDSISLLKGKETELNVCSQVDLSLDENKTDEPLVDHTISDGMSVDEDRLEQQLNNTEETECSETQTHSSELEIETIFSPAQSNMDMELKTCYNISATETQEDSDFFQKEVHIEFSKTDKSCLDSQESENNKEEDEPTESTHVYQTEDNVNFGVSNTDQKDFVTSLSSDLTYVNARVPIASQQNAEEMKEMDNLDHQQSKIPFKNNDNSADTKNSIYDSSVDISGVSDQSTTQLKDTEDMEASFSESQELCTEINDSTSEPMSAEESPVKEPQTTSPLTKTPLELIRRRQRCTSATIEDAMLFLDAINQQKYKASHPALIVTTHTPVESIDSGDKISEHLDSSETTQVMEADNTEIEDDQHKCKTLSNTTPTKLPSGEGRNDNEVKDDMRSTDAPISSPKSLAKTDFDKTTDVVQTTGPAAQSDDGCQQNVLNVTLASPVEKNEPTTQTIPQINLTIPDKTIKVTDISSHLTHSDNDHQQNYPTVSTAPLLQQASTLNHSAPPTVLQNMPTDPDEHKTQTALQQTLSPAQLSAVLSAVRSSQNSNSSKVTASNPTKRTLIAVPFSLQSVMRPHHKIIVIPRQCRAPPSQAVATNDQAIVQPKKQFTTDHTTSNITSIITPDTSSEAVGDATVPQDNALNKMEINQHSPLITQPAQSPLETIAMSATVTPKCKNKVQIRLRRLPFAISTAHSVSVSNISNGSSKIIIRKTVPKNQPVKAPSISPLDSTKCEAQTVTNTQPMQTKPIGIIGPILPSSPVEMPIQNEVQNDKSTRVNPSSAIVQFSPIVSGDHSYPQLCMTKSQFLAQLDVSPVIQASNKVANGKEVPKMSLVDRLRNHLAKPGLQTIRTESNRKVGDQNCSHLDLAANKTTDTSINDKTCGLDEQLSDVAKEMSCFPDSNTHVGKDDLVSPRRSPGTNKVSDDGHIKRKSSTASTTTTVKKPRLKGSTENENNPIPIKILCNNALISCTKRRRSYRHAKQKTFLCKFCHKEFLKKADIETHVQMHVGKKPFQCTNCAKRFSKILELSKHLKRHKRVRKLPCPTCGKLFVDHNNLRRHSYIHMEIKPYSCPHCPKTFSQACHRKSHMKSKHKNNDF